MALGVLAQQGRDKLTLVVPDSLSDLGLWLEQLIAESTGKEGKGILPVAGEPLADVGRLRPGPGVCVRGLQRPSRRGQHQPS